MTTGLIQPIPTVQAAIKAGLITGHGLPNHVPGFVINALEGITSTETITVKTPEEAGIARLPICPKQDKRRLPKPKQVRRYIITQKELRQQGFSRQEIQHIKNEVRSQ